MDKMFILLCDPNKVEKFISIIKNVEGNVYIQRDCYIVNGKSFCGLHSLDLSKVLCLYSDNPIPDNIKKQLKQFCIE